MALKQGIYLGDALKLLKKVKDESVDLIVTDPPYNVTQDNNLDTMGRRGIDFAWDGEFDQTSWLRDGVRALKPGGTFVSFNDWKNLGDVSKALKLLGMNVKRQLAWYKTNPMPRNKDRVPVQRMEYAIYAVKPGAPWAFNLGAAPNKLKKCCKPYLGDDSKYCGSCGRRVAPKGYEDGIFYHSIQRDYLHPTKKPDELWEDIIKVFSNEGDTVLDPFAGVGTLAVAATRTGRKHISFEMDWLYVMWANHRWKQELSKQAVTV
jgi:DNA modification methylase